MAAELPLLSAVLARLPDSKLHLAAYGAVAFPIALVIEGPIIMLLAASTALCTHWASYLRVRRFMFVAGALLTLLHVAVAFTPLYSFVAVDLLDTQPEVVGPGRVGLMILTPWTWSIAYRRFQQGILIRFEEGRAVTLGTLVRLITNVAVLGGAAALGLPGIVVGASAISAGVLAEALYAGWRVRPVLARLRRVPDPGGPPLSLARFIGFYLPLAVTPLITLFIQPIGAAAMNRLSNPRDALAVWPAVHGLVFLMRSMGMAYNEVVVTLAGAPGARRALGRFHRLLAGATMLVLLALAVTPLGRLWFARVIGFDPWLSALGVAAVAVAIPMPGYQALQSWYQGALVARHRTRAITEAVVLYFVLCTLLLAAVVASGADAQPGIVYALGCFVVAGLAQTAYLAWRAQPVLAQLDAEARAAE